MPALTGWGDVFCPKCKLDVRHSTTACSSPCLLAMDFWSRLIGGSRSLSAKVSRPASPTERLTTFKRTCNTLQQIWRSSTAPTSDQSATTHARTCIDRLNAVLSDESRGPAPHPCLAYAASSQIFVTVTKLALSSSDDAILRSATTFFNTLIDSEVDGVVDNRLFARALVDLVRRADKHSEDVEGRLVELLFGIANNIRLQPPILPAWFAPRSDEPERDAPTANSGAEFAGAMRKDDFPLFYLLVEYVHHAGRAGDFARTGLLYLIETASRSKDLERWLIESDLATLMATGLGALYSQLGSLSFEMAVEENVPHIIALSDHAKQETALSPSLGLTMDSFMSYLLFWQDTIDHCKSAEVNATLLDHFQVLFLEQLLYPSLLESSDVQGGSTAAVLTYLCRILNSIEQRDLVHRILHFLLASPSAIEAKPRTNVDMSLSRRKSLDVLAAFSEEAARPSPSLFNLRDLTLLGMQSANRQTVLATLRLMAVVLQRHHTFARYLIRTVPDQPAQQRTVGALNAELQNLVGMATSIVDDPTLDESFDNYLRDATWVVESRLYIPPAEDDADCPLEMRRDDPIVQELLHCLEDFFANSVIVNLALTEVLMSIASSHLISLDGWLLVDPSKYKYPCPDNASTGDSEAMHILEQIQFAHHEPTWSSADAPTVTSVLQKLVGRIQQWRTEVPDFDILVAARRDLLHHEGDPTQQQPRGERTPGTPTRGSSERPPRKAPREFDIGSPRGRKSRPLDLQSLTSSPQRSAVGSPLREPSILSSQSRDSSAARAAAAAEELRARLAKPFEVVTPHRTPVEESPDDVGDGVNGEERDSAIVDEEPQSATLGHVLTNVVILYEFLLEIAAMVQARATIFGEAGYPMVDGEVS